MLYEGRGLQRPGRLKSPLPYAKTADLQLSDHVCAVVAWHRDCGTIYRVPAGASDHGVAYG